MWAVRGGSFFLDAFPLFTFPPFVFGKKNFNQVLNFLWQLFWNRSSYKILQLQAFSYYLLQAHQSISYIFYTQGRWVTTFCCVCFLPLLEPTCEQEDLMFLSTFFIPQPEECQQHTPHKKATQKISTYIDSVGSRKIPFECCQPNDKIIPQIFQWWI